MTLLNFDPQILLTIQTKKVRLRKLWSDLTLESGSLFQYDGVPYNLKQFPPPLHVFTAALPIVIRHVTLMETHL